MPKPSSNTSKSKQKGNPTSKDTASKAEAKRDANVFDRMSPKAPKPTPKEPTVSQDTTETELLARHEPPKETTTDVSEDESDPDKEEHPETNPSQVI